LQNFQQTPFFVFGKPQHSPHFCTVNNGQQQTTATTPAIIDHLVPQLFMRLYTGNPNAAQTSAAFFLHLYALERSALRWANRLVAVEGL
jgi:hypothetical protein